MIGQRRPETPFGDSVERRVVMRYQTMSDVIDMTETLITLTADIVSAHVSNNSVAVGDVPDLIQNVHGALIQLGQTTPEPEVKQEPAVSVRSSVKPDYIVCLEDGK